MTLPSPIYLTLAAFALLTAGCGEAQPPPGPDPVFDWFEVRGEDPFFDGLSITDSTYLNPIVAGFYPDPSIVGVGGDYYLVHSSFSYFPGIPVFHSRDLVSWTQLGNVIDRSSQADFTGLGVSRGVFAPTIRHNDGVFYVIVTLVDGMGNVVFTATDPSGPWSEPIPLPEIDGIDPSIFFDDDGSAYITNNGPPPGEPLYNGHRAIWVREFTPATGTTGTPQLLVDGGVDIAQEPIWIEAPHLFKVDGRYYLIAAEGGTGEDHSAVVFRADSPMGPFVPAPVNPILTQRHLDANRPRPVTSTGHADLVQTESGDWWSVFLGTRPYAEGLYYNTGRETFLLPVIWADGWPAFPGGLAPIEPGHARPNLPPDPPPARPTTGNFVLRDDFSRPLTPDWITLRGPWDSWLDTETAPGWIRLIGSGDSLSGSGRPAFVGRRQQHTEGSFRTAIRYRPSSPADRAGLVAFQSEGAFYLLRVTDIGVAVDVQDGNTRRILSELPLDTSSTVYLRIDTRGSEMDFFASTKPDDWIAVLKGADARLLSTRRAGGFVGAVVGLYSERSR